MLPLAAASYAIYLFHRFAPELLLAGLEARVPPPAFAVLDIAGGIALGLAVQSLRRPLRLRVAALRARLAAPCGDRRLIPSE